MSLFDDEDFPSLSPVQFFGLSSDCLYRTSPFKKGEKGHLLPSTGELLDEEVFTEVYTGWSMERLFFYIEVNVPFQKIVEGDPQKGDSIELFLDTRDLKSRASLSRFCHHFLFFPAPIQNFYGREVTRFRSEETHKLCHPEDLQVEVELKKKSYSLSIEIPSLCLHGYDPLSFSRLGFTYRINRAEGPPQHFAISSEEYPIEQHPALWGTLKLAKE